MKSFTKEDWDFLDWIARDAEEGLEIQIKAREADQWLKIEEERNGGRTYH